MQSLNNQRILVIGGSSGIGLAIAAATADAGAAVTIASRNLEKLTAVASKLSGAVHIAVLDTGDNGLLEVPGTYQPKKGSRTCTGYEITVSDSPELPGGRCDQITRAIIPRTSQHCRGFRARARHQRPHVRVRVAWWHHVPCGLLRDPGLLHHPFSVLQALRDRRSRIAHSVEEHVQHILILNRR